MKKCKKGIALLMVMMVILSFAGCSQKSDETSGDNNSTEQTGDATKAPDASSDSGEDTTYKIGFSQCILDSPFYVAMKDVAEDYAKELGVEFVYADAQNDVSKQNTDIQDLISSGIDALILNPVNAEGVQPGIEACKAAGIPVITVDRNVSDGNTAYVGRDNEEMGRLVGEALVELLGGKEKASGKILEIQGAAGDTVMMARRDGFENAIAEAPGLQVIQSAYCDYTRSKAVTATQDLIQSNPDIIAVYGHNDDMSLGALQVLQENGINDVVVTGVDGLMEAVKKIKEGAYAITAMNDPGSLGKAAVDTTLKILKGEAYDEYVDAGTGVIDKSNVDDFVDDSLTFAAMK
jgi:ribose transport system substrate-binding protein